MDPSLASNNKKGLVVIEHGNSPNPGTVFAELKTNQPDNLSGDGTLLISCFLDGQKVAPTTADYLP